MSGGDAPNNLTFTLTSGSLPLGITLDTTFGSATAGTIRGVPDASCVGNTYTVTIQVAGYRGMTATATLSLIVSDGPPTAATVTYPLTGVDNTGAARLLQLYGGTSVDIWPVTSGVVSSYTVSGNTGIIGLPQMPRRISTTFLVIFSGTVKQGALRVTGSTVSFAANVQVSDLTRQSPGLSTFAIDVVSPDQMGYPDLWGANHDVFEGDLLLTQPYSIGLNAPSYTLTSGTTSLPTGLSFDPTTGRIAGTPASGTAGSYRVTVNTTYPSNATATRSNTYTLIISSGPSPPAPAVKCPAGPLTVTAGMNVHIPVAIRGLVSSYSMSGLLPTGLVFDSSSGVISGVFSPAAGTPFAASYTVNITVTGPGGSSAASSDLLTIIPVYAPLYVFYPTPAACDAGSPVVIAPAVFGIPSTSTFALQSAAPQLPPGLSLDPATGQFTGTPTVPGTYTLVVQTTGQWSASPATSTIVLTVYHKVAVYYPRVLSVIANQPFLITPVTLRAIPGYTTYAMVRVSGTLPSTLTFSTTTGVLSGTLPGTYSFVISITATGPGVVSDAVVITAASPVRPLAVAYPASPFQLDSHSIAAYNIMSTSTGFPTSFTPIGTLPAGMSFQTIPSATSGAAGQLSGRPSTAGPFSFSVQVAAAGGTVTVRISGSVI